MKPWKRHESQTAKKLGGKRIVRNHYGEKGGDIEHPDLGVECKLRSRLPGEKFILDGLKQAEKDNPGKIPALSVKRKGMHGEFIIMWLDGFVEYSGIISQNVNQKLTNSNQ
jgi:hypothetical protein